MVASMIVAITLVSMMRVFIYCSTLAEISRNLTAAMAEAQNTVEQIRNHNYSSIAVDYGSGGTPGNTFSLTLLNGKGAITINSSNADLLQVDVVVSWQDQNNRIVGEDLDLDGVLDVGEDANGNGVLDSPVKLSTLVARR